MPRTPKAPVNPEMLRWAREIAGFTAEEAARRLRVKVDRLMAWEQGRNEPSLAQLRRLADLYGRTPALFFLHELPPLDLPKPPDFRRSDIASAPNPGLRREMRRAVERRRAFLTLHGRPPRELRDLDIDISNLSEAALAARDALGVSLEIQRNAGTAAIAMNQWLKSVERLGVLIFQMSRIDPSECRGFSIHEAVAPVIVINGSDPPEARSFTLLHELCHLLNQSGGVCALRMDDSIERACNSFAAEVLMPEKAFLAVLGLEDPMEAIPNLASRFHVSQEAASVRLHVLGRITQDQLDEMRRRTAQRVEKRRQKEKEKGGGPPHYRTQLRNLGHTYVAAVLDAYYADQISLADAAHYLDSKISTIEKMETELQKQ